MTQEMPARLKIMALLCVCLFFYLVCNERVLISLGIVVTWSSITSKCEAPTAFPRCFIQSGLIWLHAV